ncbi:MAG: alpha/beta fold hydrolase [Actinomycetota bacterium]|nr:alpha/beta fold hydrolase [Actinomycetota bacterium]
MDTWEVGDVALQCGITLPNAELVISTHGSLDRDGSNLIVFPTRFGGIHSDNEYLIGEGMALDPRRYFIIVPNLLGNGVSTSPSNVTGALAGGRFPAITIYDNVVLQQRVVAERYGVDQVRLAVGWSMGGQQVYHWAALFADSVERLAVICGSARTSPHNWVFLAGMKAALTADTDWRDGAYEQPPKRGLRAIGRTWAGWALSQAFYRAEMFRQMGYSSLEDFMVRYWEELFLNRDPNNVLSMIDTWQRADISANPTFAGDFEAAMRAITAKVVLMPGATDLYFPPEDSQLECELLADARLSAIPSVWGHYAGGGRSPDDVAFIDRELSGLLAE